MTRISRWLFGDKKSEEPSVPASIARAHARAPEIQNKEEKEMEMVAFRVKGKGPVVRRMANNTSKKFLPNKTYTTSAEEYRQIQRGQFVQVRESANMENVSEKKEEKPEVTTSDSVTNLTEE